MDKSWIQIKNRAATKYLEGIDAFMKVARCNAGENETVRCPCQKCINLHYHTIDDVHIHLYSDGMDITYTQWFHHGETLEDPIQEVHVNKHTKKWDNMVRLSNPTEGDNTPSLTSKEVFFETLGSRPGYVIGLGHGELPEPSDRAHRHADLDATRRAEQAELVAAELRTEVQVLRGTIDTQETSMQGMRGTIQTMEARQIKMEQMFQAFMSGQPRPSH